MINKKLLNQLSIITDEEKRYLSEKNGIDRSIYMENKGHTVSGSKLLKPESLISIRTHPRYVYFPKHSHDFIELVYMCSGKTSHIVNGNEIVLNEGEILLLGQGATQEIQPAGEGDIAINFIILPEFFFSSIVMFENEDSPLKTFIINSLKKNEENSGYMHFKVSNILPVQNLIENLIWTLKSEDTYNKKIDGYTMGLLFLQLMNYTELLAYNNEEEKAVIKVLKYVDENYKNGSLTELSKKLHYDFNWLSREIKRKTGKTYTEIVQEKRLLKAQYLLANTDMNISDIAVFIGYDNISYFHRLFKRTVNMSPRDYRISANKDSI